MTVLGIIADRYARVRELAGVTTVSWPDDILQSKIERFDGIMKTLTQNTWTEDIPDFGTAIYISDLLTSSHIREGIGGADNITIAKSQHSQAMQLVSAIKGTIPEQHTPESVKTKGINNKSGSFG